jgi:hypothetical protein
MKLTKDSPGYSVDGRVAIGLDVLDDDEKQAVLGIIADRERFLASTANSTNVRKISTKRPVYALKGPAGLLIIYSRVGDEIVVIDLMRQETLDRYGPKIAKAKGTRSPKPRSIESPAKKAK